MSEHWAPAALADAARLADPGFVSWAELRSAAPLPASEDAVEPMIERAVPAAPAFDSGALEATAFGRGLAEGQRLAGAAIAAERAELARLAEALPVLRPEPPAALAALLAETVERLVRQIVGEVTIDTARLVARAGDLAAQVTDATRPARLRLNPADRERLDDAVLPVELIADPALAQGSLVLETDDGWVEDGPAIALERLRTALDRMGVPR